MHAHWFAVLCEASGASEATHAVAEASYFASKWQYLTVEVHSALGAWQIYHNHVHDCV